MLSVRRQVWRMNRYYYLHVSKYLHSQNGPLGERTRPVYIICTLGLDDWIITWLCIWREDLFPGSQTLRIAQSVRFFDRIANKGFRSQVVLPSEWRRSFLKQFAAAAALWRHHACHDCVPRTTIVINPTFEASKQRHLASDRFKRLENA